MFTYQSLAPVIDALESRSRTQIDHFLEASGVPQDRLLEYFNYGSKLQLLRTVFRELMLNEELSILRQMVESVWRDAGSEIRTRIEQGLGTAGLTLVDGHLTETTIATRSERSALDILIDRKPWLSCDTLKHHIKSMHELYIDGRWDASVAQGRNFIELLLLDIAKESARLRDNSPDLRRPIQVRDYLQLSGFLEENERKKLVDGVYGYMSEEGSHPGISSQRVAHLSRVLALTVGQYLIEKTEVLFTSGV